MLVCGFAVVDAGNTASAHGSTHITQGSERAFSNAEILYIGRLQPDAARARVLDGLAGARPKESNTEVELERIVQQLAPRWFMVNNAHGAPWVQSMPATPRCILSMAAHEPIWTLPAFSETPVAKVARER